MLTVNDSKFLTVLIDLESCIHKKDVVAAETLCAELNAIELNKEQKNSINEAIEMRPVSEQIQAADVYRTLMAKLDCVEHKKNKLRMLDAAIILQDQDEKAMETWLEENVDSEMFKGEGNMYPYARTLIAFCRQTKRYDKMDEIRARLQEVQ